MNRNSRLRAAGLIASLTLATVFLLVAACADATRPDDGSAAANDARVTPSHQRSAKARDELQRRNPNDWVGQVHNASLDRFRADMRKPGTMTRNVCSYLMDFVAAEDFSPPGATTRIVAAQRNGARAVAERDPLCRHQYRARAAAFRQGDLSEISLSRSASVIAYGILDAVEVASDRHDLAQRLLPLLDASASLGEPERSAMQAAISTAQSSYEYWEVELPAAQSEFKAEYYDCASSHKLAGYTSDDALAACMGAGAAYMSAPFANPYAKQGPLFLTARFPRSCSLKTQFKRLAGADASGAIIGAVKGIIGGGAGILAGAAAGAGYGSLAAFLKGTWDLYWCAME